MRHFALIGLLILIVAIIAPASAFGEYAGNITLPHWFNTTNAEASALCAEHGTTYAGGYIAGSVHYSSSWVWRGQYGADAGYNLYDTGDSGAYYFSHEVTCANSTMYKLRYYVQGAAWPVAADFVGSPTSGVAPIYVSLTDTSTNTSYTGMTYNWTISPVTGWFASSGDLSTKNVTIYFTNPGNYTVTHGASSGYSSDIETKIEYITILNQSATTTTPFTAIDLAFANPINGASISLYDIQNSSWTNGTTGADGKVSITTLTGHTINGYATAVGYDDAELLGVDAYSGGHTFYMYPTGYTNVSSGNVTVFISVVDDSNFGTALPGVTVTGMVGSTTQVGTTDGAGIARFVFPNSTDVHFGATKAGYAGTTVTINTGIPSGGSAAVTGTIHMFRGAVTPTPTVTTLPGGGLPTAVQTHLPYCDPGAADYDQAKCRTSNNEFNMSWMSANAWTLIQLCFMVTILYLLGVRLGGR